MDVCIPCPDLWELNNPYLILLDDEDPGGGACGAFLSTDQSGNPHALSCFMDSSNFSNERLRLCIRPCLFKGDIHLSAQERVWQSQVHEVTGRPIPFWIVAAGGKYDLTIKWWQTGALSKKKQLHGRIKLVSGGKLGTMDHPRLEGVIDLRGKTSVRQLVRLVYHAQAVVCPVTGLMHLAGWPCRGRTDRPQYRPSRGHRGCEGVHWEAYPE